MVTEVGLTTPQPPEMLDVMQLASLRLSALAALVLFATSCDPVKSANDAAPPQIDAAPAPTCEDYCSTIQSACTAEPQYANETVCVAHCEMFGQIPLGTSADMSGHTVGCRTYHATVAVAQNAPEIHCPHAGPSGGDVCGSWCENYCHLAMLNCTGSVALYSSETECFATCAQIPATGRANDTSGDTVQCRIHHLGLAGTEPPTSQATFCPVGDINTTERCVGLPPNP